MINEFDSGLQSQNQLCPLLLTALLNEIDVQWYKDVPKEHKTKKDLTKRVEFSTLESIALERFF